jgi:glutamate-1-semialdehyde 2,1-aminomutase
MSRYSNSESHLIEAESFIPLGSQTFSKSRTQYPVGISPLFAERSNGAFMWDVDGNRYLDLVGSLACVTLGYQNKHVLKSVKRQLQKGTIHSLPGKLEAEVAERIIDLVPSAELVRFGKNGSDATSAAVRLSRAYTGRKVIAVCGYHGWQDWYIGSTTRNKGIPVEISMLTESFVYNQIDSLKAIFAKHTNDVAAVIMEPMTSVWPMDGFLSEVKELCVKNGSVLIFDETITGFRFQEGGAQELFGVTPDLTTLGKGIANGFPLSAVVGKADIMNEMKEIFFSGTFGGELLSLAAANKVLSLHQDKKIVPKLIEIGDLLSSSVEEVIVSTGNGEVVFLSGHPTWKFLNWSPHDNASVAEIKTYFMQEMFSRGILVLGTHNVSTSFKSKHIHRIKEAYREVLEGLGEALYNGDLSSKLQVKPLEPLFRVR